jgi:hypothetical protein
MKQGEFDFEGKKKKQEPKPPKVEKRGYKHEHDKEQEAELNRVRARIGPTVCDFCVLSIEVLFRAMQLFDYVESRRPGEPGSADRILRDLKRRYKQLDYICFGKRVYMCLWVYLRPEEKARNSTYVLIFQFCREHVGKPFFIEELCHWLVDKGAGNQDVIAPKILERILTYFQEEKYIRMIHQKNDPYLIEGINNARF